MSPTRRHFLQTCGAVALGFAGIHRLLVDPLEAVARTDKTANGYGPTTSDPNKIIELLAS